MTYQVGEGYKRYWETVVIHKSGEDSVTHTDCTVREIYSNNKREVIILSGDCEKILHYIEGD